MKKNQILHLNIQSAESVLRKGSLFCIYGTVFATLRHQSIYWLPKCATKDVLPFPLYNSAHLGWSVPACSEAQNPVRHEPALPTNWSCLKPQAQALQHLSIHLYKHLKGGCKADGQSQPFFSDAQWQDRFRGDWNKLKHRRAHLNIRKHVFYCDGDWALAQVACTTRNPSGRSPGHPAVGGPPWAGAWGLVISRGPS